MITGITVCCNSKELVQKAYESVRRFHPDMMVIIVDGSDEWDECRSYVNSLHGKNTTLMLAKNNIGHGRAWMLP